MSHTYGMSYRPAGYGTVPPGRVATDPTPTPDFFHGTVTYDRELTPEECATFQLAPVPAPARRPTTTTTEGGATVAREIADSSADAHTLNVVFRRFPVPSDRRPRCIMPGDYFAVLVGEPATYGKLAAIVAYTDGGHDWTCSEIDSNCDHHCPLVPPDAVPASLLDYLRWNPDGPEFVLNIRRRIRHAEKLAAWKSAS